MARVLTQTPTGCSGFSRTWADGRGRRLVRLGFPPEEADTLAALHTRNFM